MKKIDMSWGSPSFLNDYWDRFSIEVDFIEKSNDYKLGSKDSLKKAIASLHKKINNAEIKNKYIVVGAGATQILAGLFWVFKNKFNVKNAWANPPYFMRFPKISEISGLKWKNHNESLQIITSPNNPDGKVKFIFNKNYKNYILDLCYNWPQYTDIIYKFDHPIMVFSLGKATGHASTRIGWAIIENKEIAEALEQYIEISTSGISIDAQVKAEQAINSQLEDSLDETVFEYGKKELRIRWGKVLKLKPKFKILNNSGMFLWAKGECPNNIQSINGAFLGETSKHFRLNLGCSSSTFKSFIDSVGKKGRYGIG